MDSKNIEDFVIKGDHGWKGLKTIKDIWMDALVAKAITYEEFKEYKLLTHKEQQNKLDEIRKRK